MSYPLGSRLILSVDFRNGASVLTNPTTVTVDVRKPDDTALSPVLTPTNPSTGRYEAVLVVTTPGQWAWRWTGVGNSADAVVEGTIEVADSPFATADSYDDEPGTNPADELRLRLGDTDRANPLFTAAQLAWLLAKASGNVPAAAVLGARLMAARYAGAVDVAEGDVRRSLSQQAKGWAALVGTLEGDPATGASVMVAPIPLAGGLRYSERASRDPDLVRPYFTTEDLPTWDDDLWRRLA